MSIIQKTFSVQSKWDGVVLHGICFIPDNPIGIFQMVHGMCEHKERFLPFMMRMAEFGYVTLMHDNRGHGESVKEADDIGYCYDSKEKGFIEDIYLITKRIRKEFPGLPLILYGHSMGSLAVRAYLRTHDDAIDGLIISGSPSYNYGVVPGKLLVQIYSLIFGDRGRFPWMQKLTLSGFEGRYRSEGRASAWLAAKESVAEIFEKDPLCKFIYTLNGFTTLLNLERIVYKKGGYQVKNPELPILMISGADDPCYISEKKWYQTIYRLQELGYAGITSIRFDGMRHEIHNEEDSETVFREIDRFCREILGI